MTSGINYRPYPVSTVAVLPAYQKTQRADVNESLPKWWQQPNAAKLLRISSCIAHIGTLSTDHNARDLCRALFYRQPALTIFTVYITRDYCKWLVVHIVYRLSNDIVHYNFSTEAKLKKNIRKPRYLHSVDHVYTYWKISAITTGLSISSCLSAARF